VQENQELSSRWDSERELF